MGYIQPKTIFLSDKGRSKVKEGIDKLADMVKATLGPKGRNILYFNYGDPPVVTNDGVTIAREIRFKNAWHEAGARLVREAAQRTNDTVGDGTSTAILLTQAMINEGLKHLSVGANPVELRLGMRWAVKEVKKYLQKIAVKIETKEQMKEIGALAGESQKIGELVSGVYDKIGKNGIVTLELWNKLGLESEVVDGFRIDRGFISPYFINDVERRQTVFPDAYVLITNQKIGFDRQLVPIVEKAMDAGKMPLLIIAADIEMTALAFLVKNKMENNLAICAIRAPLSEPERTEDLEDIAVLTGGRVISEITGKKIEDATVEDLGETSKIIVNAINTTFIVNNQTNKIDINKRIKQLKGLVKTEEDDWQRNRYKERISRLQGGIGIIRIGGASELERTDTHLKVEDSVNAVRAALQKGIVGGGGTGYLKAALYLRNKLDKMLVRITDVIHCSTSLTNDERLGAMIIMNALSILVKQIAQNAGESGEKIVSELSDIYRKDKKSMIGYDAKLNKQVNLLDAGIIDPVLVEIKALQNAASVAAEFLTIEGVAVSDGVEAKK